MCHSTPWFCEADGRGTIRQLVRWIVYTAVTMMLLLCRGASLVLETYAMATNNEYLPWWVVLVLKTEPVTF
jgi:hypothetical protein